MQKGWVRVRPAHIIFGVIFTVLVLYIFWNPFEDQPKEETAKYNPNFLPIEDLIEAKKQPEHGRSLFFIDTTCNITSLEDAFRKKSLPNSRTFNNKAANLTIRQACAIESAALHHSNRTIFVLFTTNLHHNRGFARKVTESLLRYPNIHFRYLNVWKIVSQTSFFDWFSKGRLFESSYPIEHMSDFLRLLVLWKYGGIYLDTDVIVLRSMEELGQNFIAAETDTALGNQVIGISSEGIGHAIAEIGLNEFQSNYRPDLWSHNGPLLFERIFKGLCRETNVVDMVKKVHCMGFDFLPIRTFCPISYAKWNEIFANEFLSSSLNAVKDSYAIHLWNKLSKSVKLNEGNLGLYEKLASENCPAIYALAKGHN